MSSSSNYMPSPTVPLGYHKAFHYVLLPIGILLTLVGLIGTGWAAGAFSIIVQVAMLLLMIMTFVGMFKWQSWSYVTLFVTLIIGIVSYAIVFIVATVLLSFAGVVVGNVEAETAALFSGAAWLIDIICVIVIAVNIYTLVYYSKRRMLFYGNPNQYQVMEMHKNGIPYGQPPYGNQPYGAQQPGAQQPGAQQPQAGQPYGYQQPYGAQQGNGGQPYGGQPYGAQAQQPQAGQPYGAQQSTADGQSYGAQQPTAGTQPYGTQQPDQSGAYNSQQGNAVGALAAAEDQSQSSQSPADAQASADAQAASVAQDAATGICPNCRTEIKNPNARFCPKCGSGL